MEFKELLELLVLYAHNMKVIHWNSTGDRFDRIHALADDYHGKICTTADSIGEMIGMLNKEIPSFTDVTDDLKSKDKDFLVMDAKKKYTYQDGVGYIGIMLKDIVSAIEETLDTKEMDEDGNVGIKATLESIHYDYLKELNYFNKRRS